jgi:outer membrane protein assembly factor BamE (lipoprotein component of BamABCDE complex)
MVFFVSYGTLPVFCFRRRLVVLKKELVMIRFLSFASALLFVAAILSGCATQHFSFGTEVDQSAIGFITKGVTTRGDVEARLGKPDSVTPMGDGKQLANYTYSDTQAPGVFFDPAKVKTTQSFFQVVYSTNGIVLDYVLNGSSSNS